MRENALKRAIRDDRVAIGTTLGSFAERDTPKLLEYAGFDWVLLDMEHSGWSIDTVANLIAWFKATPITVIVRPPDNLPHELAGIMDAGAMGVQVAHVDTGAEAKAVVDAVMYPPLGRRGVGLHAAHTDFSRPNAPEYMEWRNAQTSIVADVESIEGLENIDEILAIEGIDVVHFGQNDLSAALGVPEQFEHPTYKAALHRVAEACRRHGKTFKCNPHDDASCGEAYKLGCRLIGAGRTSGIFQDAMKNAVDRTRKQLGG